MAKLRNQRELTQTAYVGGEKGANGFRRVDGMGT
jgi:hypothetical protein